MRLRRAALIAVIAGAAGSFVLMLRVGHRAPVFLILLFIIWVLSPFVALVVADRRSQRWSSLTRDTLYGVMLIVALGSLVIYGSVALGPPRPKPAAAFLLVPLASWLLGVIVVPLASFVFRKPQSPGGSSTSLGPPL